MDDQARIAINIVGTDLANALIQAALVRANTVRVLQAFDDLSIESWTVTTDMEVQDNLGNSFTGPEGWIVPPEETQRLRWLFGIIQDLR